MNSIYCLDFDGVLCDSVGECAVVGYNAYYDREIEYPGEIPDDLRSFLYRNRWLIRAAGEFVLLFDAYERKTGDPEKSRFAELKESSAKAISDFSKLFYACRSRLKENFEHWISLHKAYPQAKKFLEGDAPPFYIMTNKDRDSIEKIALHCGYLHRVRAVYSKEISFDKRVLFERLFADRGHDPKSSRILYVDDNDGHLRDLRGLSLELYLAAWGYTGKIEPGRFNVIHSLDELTRKL